MRYRTLLGASGTALVAAAAALASAHAAAPRAAAVDAHKPARPIASPHIVSVAPAQYGYNTPFPGNGGKYPDTVVLTVRGRGFARGARLRFDGRSVAAAYGNSASLTASVPFGWMQDVPKTQPGGGGTDFVGTARVSVRNPNGRVSNTVRFPVTASPIGG